MIIKNGKRVGFEVKYTDMPKMTKSMTMALQGLKLDHLYVIYPHRVSYLLADRVSVVGIEDMIPVV